MYTSIIDSDGRKFQFKCGDDTCETYSLGDAAPFYIDPDRPGHGSCFDGVYTSSDARALLVVKDHKFTAIVQVSENEDMPLLVHSLKVKYHINEYDSLWWTKDQWFQKEMQDAVKSYELAKENMEFLQTLVGLSAEDRRKMYEKRLVIETGSFIRERMNSPSFARTILPNVEK